MGHGREDGVGMEWRMELAWKWMGCVVRWEMKARGQCDNAGCVTGWNGQCGMCTCKEQ